MKVNGQDDLTELFVHSGIWPGHLLKLDSCRFQGASKERKCRANWRQGEPLLVNIL